jgi:PAS domain S-box-containing protein
MTDPDSISASSVSSAEGRTPSSSGDGQTQSLTPRRRVSGDGEMAELTRSHDWSRTSPGPIAGWPERLLCSVNLMLACQFPTVIFWGPEMLQFYNDSYRPLMAEKHPAALGQGARECWKEAWHIIGPQFEATLREGQTFFMEEVLVPVLRNGALQDVYWTYSYSPIRDAAGAIDGILIVCQDVTKKVQATRERDEVARRLQQVFDLTTDGILSIDRSWRCIYANPRAQAVVAASGEFVGRNIWESFPAMLYEGSPYVEHYYRAMNQGVPGEFEVFYPEPLNVWVQVQVQPSMEGIVAYFRDVTEQKQASMALLQNEKLAAVGRLASSIAHEINNPLESVTNLIYLARQDAVNADVRSYLETAERELRRVAVITNQTLRFHKQSTMPRLVNCEELFESVLSIYQGRIVNAQIRVERRPRGEAAVMCFDGEIRQVLNNLVSNAIDAMHPKGGRMILYSRETTEWRTGRRGIVLTVADSGEGMSAEASKRAFEPFFTTKGDSGTGLGLWVSWEIVSRHQGVLRVRSSRRQGCAGTVFTVFLPFEVAKR